MVDPITSAAVGEASKVGGGVLARLLGPTADVMGSQLVEWYKRTNVERVARKADAKANTTPGGSIPPRVAAGVFEKAQWADDEFVAEYLSGVLASAKSPGGKDDSAVTWTALVGRLSSLQLRLHYVLYTLLRELKPASLEGQVVTTRMRQLIVVQMTSLFRALSDACESDDALLEAAHGLAREGILENLSHGHAGFLAEQGGDFRHRGIKSDGNGLFTFCATPAGVALYLWGMGRGRAWIDQIWLGSFTEMDFGDANVGRVDGVWLSDVERTDTD